MDNTEMEQLQKQGKKALEDFINHRAKAVSESRETAELAGLMIRNYGDGLAKMLGLFATLKNFPEPSLVSDVSRYVSQVDPDWELSAVNRMQDRPAGIQHNAPMPKRD